MTDYECRQQEFAGWANEKRIAFIHDLTAILKNTVRCGVAASMAMEDWLAIMPPSFERPEFVAKNGAYQFLFQLCVEALVKHGKPSEPIACVFDDNQFVRGALAEHFEDFKRELQLEETLVSLNFGNKLKFLPVQAADLVAYESYKHVKTKLSKVELGSTESSILIS
jgi:hypothetical protein